jgi:hypothetical protein
MGSLANRRLTVAAAAAVAVVIVAERLPADHRVTLSPLSLANPFP